MNVVVKGTSNGTTTDDDGTFSINVKSLPVTLVISSLGYKTKEVQVENTSPLTIVVEEGSEALEGISVTGSRTPARSNIKSALPIDIVSSKDLVAVEGAVVAIDVVVAEAVDAIVVPIAAVLTENSSEKIRVVTRDGTLERRIVESGMLDGAWVEVISGVSPEEFVIIEIDRS